MKCPNYIIKQIGMFSVGTKYIPIWRVRGKLKGRDICL